MFLVLKTQIVAYLNMFKHVFEELCGIWKQRRILYFRWSTRNKVTLSAIWRPKSCLRVTELYQVRRPRVVAYTIYTHMLFGILHYHMMNSFNKTEAASSPNTNNTALGHSFFSDRLICTWNSSNKNNIDAKCAMKLLIVNVKR